MTERTLRDRIAALLVHPTRDQDDMIYNLAIGDALAALDTHTAAQPAPDAAPTVNTALLAEVKRLRPHYQSGTSTDIARRQLLDHFEAFAIRDAQPADLQLSVPKVGSAPQDQTGVSPASDAVAAADPAGVAAATEIIQWQGKEATACAMIQHIATTLKEKGKGLITTDPASFGQTILEFDAALTALGKKAKP